MRILVAEDEPVSRLRLKAQLVKWGYDVVLAKDGAEAWAILGRDDAPRLAILDWMMPGMDGPEVCARIREKAAEPYVYVLLLTGKGEKDDVVAGLDAGADDYLTKPFDARELEVRLRAGCRIVTLQAELVTAREALRFEATHDVLTSAYNRAAAMKTLAREVARSNRSSEPLAVAMIDVDHFKRVNDTLGHQGGDEVLREIVRRLEGAIRPYDTLGRYGGEELIAILPGCDARAAASAAERLRARVGHAPVVFDGATIEVTCSIGVAVGQGCGDGTDLVAAADAALYAAKRAGRNRVELAGGAAVTDASTRAPAA